MGNPKDNHRREPLDGLRRFIRTAHRFAGVQEIAVVGSITTAKPNPKDFDILLVVVDDADLAPIAAAARRLQGHAESVNFGADVLLANTTREYIGRTCHWKDCRPGVRMACDALHCGHRPHLHDDLETIRLEAAVVQSPPVTVWPKIIRRGPLSADLEELLANLEDAV